MSVIFAQSAFVGNTNIDVRYLWDPIVHERFGERCYFLLLGLQDAGAASLKDLEARAKEAGVRCFSAYLVFGSFDVVIRFWATPTAHDRLFQDVLTLGLRSTDDFTALLVDYSGWTDQDRTLTLQDVARHQGKIGTVCNPTASPNEARAAMAGLRDARLVHKLIPSPTKMGSVPVKLYIGMKRVDDGRQGDLRFPAILERFALQLESVILPHPELRSPSLYFGVGRYDCIVKAIYDSGRFDQLTETILSIKSDLLTLGMTTLFETMIVGGETTQERDIINPDYIEGGPTGVLLEACVSPLYRGLVPGLRDPWRSAVFESFDHWCDRFMGDEDFDSAFIEIIESGLRCDLVALWGACTWVIRYDNLIREQLVKSVLPRLLTDRWHGIVISQLEHDLDSRIAGLGVNDAAKINKDRTVQFLRRTLGQLREDPRGLSLGDYVGILSRLCDGGACTAEAIAEELGPDWGTWFETIRGLRNDIGHYERIEEYRGKGDEKQVERWGELSGQALSAADLIISLRPTQPWLENV